MSIGSVEADQTSAAFVSQRANLPRSDYFNAHGEVRLVRRARLESAAQTQAVHCPGTSEPARRMSTVIRLECTPRALTGVMGK